MLPWLYFVCLFNEAPTLPWLQPVAGVAVATTNKRGTNKYGYNSMDNQQIMEATHDMTAESIEVIKGSSPKDLDNRHYSLDN